LKGLPESQTAQNVLLCLSLPLLGEEMLKRVIILKRNKNRGQYLKNQGFFPKYDLFWGFRTAILLISGKNDILKGLVIVS